MVTTESVVHKSSAGARAGAGVDCTWLELESRVAMIARAKMERFCGVDRPFHQTYTREPNPTSADPSMIQFFALIAWEALSAYAMVSDASAGSGLKPKYDSNPKRIVDSSVTMSGLFCI